MWLTFHNAHEAENDILLAILSIVKAFLAAFCRVRTNSLNIKLETYESLSSLHIGKTVTKHVFTERNKQHCTYVRYKHQH